MTIGDWSGFFGAQTASFAALTGLIFVALSINLKTILELPAVPGRAAEALIFLLEPVLFGLAGLVAHQSVTALGVEWLVVGVLGWAAVGGILIRGREGVLSRPKYEIVAHVGGAQLATLPLVVAGALLLGGVDQAFYWQAAGVALCLVVAMHDAWVLLVEILR